MSYLNKRRLSKFPTIIMDLFIPIFTPANFCFLNFKVLLLGAYIVRMVMSFWCIAPFMIIKCPYLSPIFIFLKSTLSDIKISTVDFFWLVFLQYIFFFLVTFNFFIFKVHLLETTYLSYFFILTNNLNF